MERRRRSMSPAQRILHDAIDSRFEKAERKESPAPERRPSTIIDDNGCIIQRGFVIPNRPSSSHSQTSRPSTPNYKPIEGFSRPTGSLYDSLEFRPLVKHHSSALHRPTKSDGDLDRMKGCISKPPVATRRQTWQSNAKSCTWTDEELAEVSCRNIAKSQRHLDREPTFTMGRPPKSTDMCRSTSVLSDMIKLGRESESEKGREEDVKIVSQGEAEDAIASDSEGDDDFIDFTKQVNYRERRRQHYARAAEEIDNYVTPNSNAEQEVPQQIKPESVNQHESAIDSDDEHEDDRVTAALRTARLYRTHNLITTSQGAVEMEEVLTRKSSKEEGHRSSLSVKITSDPMARLSVTDGISKKVVTPREIKSFEKDAPMAPRKLRPSKSRPHPKKGVLKKTESPPSSSSSSSSGSPKQKHVQTVKRPSFAAMCKDAVMPPITALTSYWQRSRS